MHPLWSGSQILLLARCYTSEAQASLSPPGVRAAPPRRFIFVRFVHCLHAVFSHCWDIGPDRIYNIILNKLKYWQLKILKAQDSIRRSAVQWEVGCGGQRRPLSLKLEQTPNFFRVEPDSCLQLNVSSLGRLGRWPVNVLGDILQFSTRESERSSCQALCAWQPMHKEAESSKPGCI